MMTVKYLLIIYCIYFFPSKYFAQLNPGSRQIALAHSGVGLNDDVFSIFNNPAGLAQKGNREIGIYYSPSPFGIEELSNSSIAFIQPSIVGNFGIGIMHYGFDLYNESILSVSYAQQIITNFLIGITNNIKLLNMKGYGSATKINFSFGGLYKIHEDFTIGFCVHNPFRYEAVNDYFSLSYESGLTFNPLMNTSINLAFSKEIDFPFSIRFGVEYPLVEFIFLRIGVQNEPTNYNGGLGIKFSYFNINYSTSSHIELGLTHQFDLIIDF